MSKWKCTICKYIAEGIEPPDICPVCRAGKDAFIRISDTKQPFDLKAFIKDLHLHPITAHIPNGLLPVIIIFLTAYFLTSNIYFEKTVFYLYITTVISFPITFASGVLDWQLRYDGAVARIFLEKIILSIIFLTLTIPTIFVRIFYPEILVEVSKISWIYIGGLLVQTGIVTRLGYLGGKLVFG